MGKQVFEGMFWKCLLHTLQINVINYITKLKISVTKPFVAYSWQSIKVLQRMSVLWKSAQWRHTVFKAKMKRFPYLLFVSSNMERICVTWKLNLNYLTEHQRTVQVVCRLYFVPCYRARHVARDVCRTRVWDTTYCEPWTGVGPQHFC
jgi:hypothetical protein